MTAATQDVKADKLGTEELPPPALLSLPVETNVIIYGGTPVFSNAAGNAVDATPANTPLFAWGRCERQINNLNTNTPFGAAGSQQVPIRPGAYYFASDGTVTVAMIGRSVFALDNQTVTINPVQSITATTWLPFLGTVQPPAVGEAGLFLPTNTRVPVYVGYPACVGQVLHAAIPVGFAQIAALGASLTGTITLAAALPANARLVGADVNVLTAVSGGAIATATVSISGGADAVTSIMGATNIFTGAPAFGAAIGTNPYPSRGGQALKFNFTTTTGNLNAATAGSLLFDIFYTLAF
jgi:hypothetical protein